MKIDFVSDVSCPWCAIGLNALETALKRLDLGESVALQFQPFELNPTMGKKGQDIDEHLNQKYGLSPEQSAANREAIRQRGASVGFTFTPGGRSRIYNTFDAHRLLHWAESQGEGRQRALKHALLAAYFTHGQDPSDHAVLTRVAGEVGLDAARAAQILASDEFTAEVRQREEEFQAMGIDAVPAVIINDKHLIQGGQPPEVFEQALRQIASGELQ